MIHYWILVEKTSICVKKFSRGVFPSIFTMKSKQLVASLKYFPIRNFAFDAAEITSNGTQCQVYKFNKISKGSFAICAYELLLGTPYQFRFERVMIS